MANIVGRLFSPSSKNGTSPSNHQTTRLLVNHSTPISSDKQNGSFTKSESGWIRSLFATNNKTTNNSKLAQQFPQVPPPSPLSSPQIIDSNESIKPAITKIETQFKPLTNYHLLKQLSSEMTISLDGRQQLRMEYEPNCFDLITETSTLNEFAQYKPINVSSRIGVLLYDKMGNCRFNNIQKNGQIQRDLISALRENFIDCNQRGKGKCNQQSINDLSYFDQTITEMIFGSIELRKETKNGIDLNGKHRTPFRDIECGQKNGQSFAFKMHDLTKKDDNEVADVAVEHDLQSTKTINDLFMTSFIVELKLDSNPYHLGIAIVWRCPRRQLRSKFSMFDLLFNTPRLLTRFLADFSRDLACNNILRYKSHISASFERFLFRINEYLNAIRLINEPMSADYFLSNVIELLEQYDKKESSFFVTTLLSTLLSLSYKQNRLKLVLWTERESLINPMITLAIVMDQFRVRTVDTDPDGMNSIVIEPEFHFQTEKDTPTVMSNSMQSNLSDYNTDPLLTQTLKQQQQPIPPIQSNGTTPSNNNNFISTFGIRTTKSNDQVCESNALCLRADRKSRDESIGYESLTSEGEISGNVSPTSIEDNDENYRLIAKQREMMNNSQSTDYDHYDHGIPITNGLNNRNHHHQSFNDQSNDIMVAASQRQSYFRGYMDMRFKDTVELSTNQTRTDISSVELLEENGIDEQIDTNSTHEHKDEQSNLSLKASESEDGKNLETFNNGSVKSNIPIVILDDSIAPSILNVTIERKTNQSIDAGRSSSLSSPTTKNVKMNRFDWIECPVLSTHHLDLVQTQVIFGSARESSTTTATTNPLIASKIDTIRKKLLAQLNRDQSSETIILCDCDQNTIELLEYRSNEKNAKQSSNTMEMQSSTQLPMMSNTISQLTEMIVLMMKTINLPSDIIMSYISDQLSQLAMKANLVQSIVRNDSHQILANTIDQRSFAIDGSMPIPIESIVNTRETFEMENELKHYRNELLFELSKHSIDYDKRFWSSSHLYLFDDYHMDRYLRVNRVLNDRLSIDLSDLPVIFGLKKLINVIGKNEQNLLINNSEKNWKPPLVPWYEKLLNHYFEETYC